MKGIGPEGKGAGARVAVGVVAVALLLLAGCGGDSESDSTADSAAGAQGDLGAQLQELADAGRPTAGLVEGTWDGQLQQTGVDPFPITVTLRTVTRKGANTVRYGGEIGCAGSWSFISGEGNVARFEEVIDSGKGGNCKGRGEVRIGFLREDAAELSYKFMGGGVESSGVLRRAE
ncbi:MAG TPA: hypothetical protein VKA36_10090 [Solirubrobacterales bacterium]|nr:hypothetical protein [Solirubrobacterales bacterium]